MKFITRALTGASFFFATLALGAVEMKDLLPKEFEYCEVTYLYDPYWKDEELIYEVNFDSDPELEVIIAFGAVSHDKDNAEPGYFWQIYDRKDDTYLPVKTQWANKYPTDIIPKDLNNDEIQEIILYGESGIHADNISVYQWRKGNYCQIFGHSTVYGIYVNLDSEKPLIEVGAPNWERMKEPDPEFGWHYMAKPLREIYVWDQETFTYNELLSTAPAHFSVHTIARAQLYSRPLSEELSLPEISSLKDERIEHIRVYLDNRKFYSVYPQDNPYFEAIKHRIVSGERVRIEKVEENNYRIKLLFDQEIEFIARYDESLDGTNPVFVF